MTDKLRAPATARNREPIREVLARYVRADDPHPVVEIASGSGEHAVHMARAFSGVAWQPSDRDAAALQSIAAWRAEVGGELANLRAPLDLDVCEVTWPVEHAQLVVCINMIHIAPWEAAVALFRGAADILDEDRHLFLYGPFRFFGRFNAPSNKAFDDSLKARDARWGIRDLADLGEVATQHGFVLEEVIGMPANNHCVTWRKL